MSQKIPCRQSKLGLSLRLVWLQLMFVQLGVDSLMDVHNTEVCVVFHLFTGTITIKTAYKILKAQLIERLSRIIRT